MNDGIISIDKAGRVVVPKIVRERLGLRPGSRLGIRIRDDHLELHPVDEVPSLKRDQGWWVHQGRIDTREAATDALARHRRDRIELLSR